MQMHSSVIYLHEYIFTLLSVSVGIFANGKEDNGSVFSFKDN